MYLNDILCHYITWLVYAAIIIRPNGPNARIMLWRKLSVCPFICKYPIYILGLVGFGLVTGFVSIYSVIVGLKHLPCGEDQRDNPRMYAVRPSVRLLATSCEHTFYSFQLMILKYYRIVTYGT